MVGNEIVGQHVVGAESVVSDQASVEPVGAEHRTTPLENTGIVGAIPIDSPAGQKFIADHDPVSSDMPEAAVEVPPIKRGYPSPNDPKQDKQKKEDKPEFQPHKKYLFKN